MIRDRYVIEAITLVKRKHGSSYPHAQLKAAQLKGLLHAGLRRHRGCEHASALMTFTRCSTGRRG